MSRFSFSIAIMPREGILDPQGKAVEAALPQLGAATVHGVRIGRRIELTVEADDAPSARAVVEKLAAEFLANPLVERWAIDEGQPLAGVSG
ncbi:MAG TPA: phosphoribosylformylglycinamidine synthase subunit PurS [Candidatus Limnocylindrales bacterium]|nr:phosphoribosylformylglycinamidine synthase subunit PurS [Candidatus Limnocylindrales bacterium]